MTRITGTDLDVSRVCLGGNVFGWTVDESGSPAVLDAFVEAGGTFIDTADVYSQWADGHTGGESESIIGRWMAARRNRDDVVIASKVGMKTGLQKLTAATIRSAAEDSLRRLGTDHIDLYYAHIDDRTTPLEETLTAFDALVRDGLVRHIAASNISAERLEQALTISEQHGLAAYVAVQPHYNLMHRDEYEGPLRTLVTQRRLACFPYFALAEGFLTGKYRPGGPAVDSERTEDASAFLTARGLRVLAALDAIAAGRALPLAAVALAWLTAQPGVVAPIASARTPEQVAALAPALVLRLSSDEVAQLDIASRP